MPEASGGAGREWTFKHNKRVWREVPEVCHMSYVVSRHMVDPSRGLPGNTESYSQHSDIIADTHTVPSSHKGCFTVSAPARSLSPATLRLEITTGCDFGGRIVSESKGNAPKNWSPREEAKVYALSP